MTMVMDRLIDAPPAPFEVPVPPDMPAELTPAERLALEAPMHLDILVNDDDIANGIRGSLTWCPIARRLRRTFEGEGMRLVVKVGQVEATVRFGWRRTSPTVTYDHDGVHFVRQFDHSDPYGYYVVNRPIPAPTIVRLTRKTMQP